MDWTKSKHSGSKGYHSECSRCDKKFSKGDTCYITCFGRGQGKITEIVCPRCQERCGLRVRIPKKK